MQCCNICVRVSMKSVISKLLLLLLLDGILVKSDVSDLHGARIYIVEKAFDKVTHEEPPILDKKPLDHGPNSYQSPSTDTGLPASDDPPINKGQDTVLPPVVRSNNYPDLLPLELHTNDARLLGLLLTRNRRLDQGFDIISYDAEFSTIPAGHLQTGAFYQDALGSGVFGLRQDASGQREYQGSFLYRGQHYNLAPDDQGTEAKRSSARAYIARRIEPLYFGVDSLLSPPTPQYGFSGRSAEKRSTAYNVELTIFVEFSEYNAWLAIEGSQSKALEQLNYKFSYTLNAMDAAYKSISSSRHGYTVTPWIKKLVVNTNGANSPIHKWVSGIDSSADPRLYSFKGRAVLDNLSGWASGQGLEAGSDTDHTMFWLRFNILSDEGNEGTIGQAFVGGVCQARWGYSVIEDTGFESWHTASHELGHNLGASHDGSGDAAACSATNHNIMTSISGFPDPAVSRTGGYEFSSCSIDAMKNTLSGTTCLSNSGTNGFGEVDVSPLPGQVYDRTAQCRLIYGDAYSDCAAFNDDTSCWKGLWCTLDGRSCTASSRPADGTDCGNGKTCVHGYCQ